jgi:RNA polymerase sigma factor (sigma-70 family)
MQDRRTVAALVRCAAAGDDSAWRAILRAYSPLVRSVCRRYGLRGAAAEDVCATVWLRLVDRVGSIREPAALPGWLATSARRECLQHMRKQVREDLIADLEDTAPSTVRCDTRLLVDERHVAVREAIAQLPRREQRLLSLLFSDPPTPYEKISAILDMPVGAIGPTRQRCLTRMRRSPALVDLMRNPS